MSFVVNVLRSNILHFHIRTTRVLRLFLCFEDYLVSTQITRINSMSNAAHLPAQIRDNLSVIPIARNRRLRAARV